MRRALLLLTALAALGLAPAGAQATVTELGADAAPESVKADCPDACAVVTRVSGYMARSGKGTNPFQIPRDGKILAFTVSLGKPAANQVAQFSGLYGGPPQVRISVIRRGKTRKTRLNHRLLRQSDLFDVTHYFGSRPTFVFDTPIKVSKGNIIALTVPTWAPVFNGSLPKDNWWRSSRKKGQCGDAAQRAAQRTPGAVRVYGCTYFGARLLYTVTYAPDPRPTDGTKP